MTPSTDTPTSPSPRPPRPLSTRVRAVVAARPLPVGVATGAALLSLLAVPVLDLSREVEVVVDGRVAEVEVERTVGDVLAAEGIELAAGDRVLPSQDTPITEPTSVKILRTIDVELVVDGEPTTVRGAFRNVAGALQAVGLTELDGASVSPALPTRLEGGDEITVVTPRTLTLTVDGATRELTAAVDSVEDVLAIAGVELGELDLVTPNRGAAVDHADHVVVQRVVNRVEVDEHAVDHERTVRGTSDLYRDESRVAVEGVDGLRREEVRVRVVDGEPTRRTVVSSELVREPVTEIVEEGTTERPAPEPEPEPAAPAASGGSAWDRLAACESGGNWSIDAYHDGGLQFLPSTWNAYKPAGYPAYAYQASREQQIVVAERVRAEQGWNAWPTCAREIGLL